MSNSHSIQPACLACNPSELCRSCLRKAAQTKGRVGRLQFVPVERRRAETNMHFGVKARRADTEGGDIAAITRALQPDYSNESFTGVEADDTLEFFEHANAIFESNFGAKGYRKVDVAAVTDTSAVIQAVTDWFRGAVAIKILRPEIMESRFAQKIFLQEAHQISKLNHPNVAALFSYGIANDAPYMVSQFVAGQSLRAFNQLNADIESLSMFVQLCEALAFAHENGVVHGRLSADKVIIDMFNTDMFIVKVIDFSVLAALRAQLPFSFSCLRDSASPEERYGLDPDFRSDIYSLGYIMYETLTGTKPSYNRAKQVVGFPDLRGAPEMLEPLVLKCLAWEQKDRYQTANELLAEVSQKFYG